MDKTRDVLIVHIPYYMKPERMQYYREKFMKELEEGVILLPLGFSCEVAPKDVEIRCVSDVYDEVHNG